jgi:urease accessory protein
MRLIGDDGSPFLLDLQQAVMLGDGDGLKLDDGSWLAVKAVEEDVVDVRCNNESALASIAWHLGNRHIPVQIIGSKLRIRHDHVIVAMLQGLGADVNTLQALFSPETGAYMHQYVHKDKSSDGYDHG